MKVFFLTALFLVFIKISYLSARSDLTPDELKRVRNVTALTKDFHKPERSESLSGGAGTVEKTGKNAFSHHFTTLSYEDRQNFLIGNGLFRKLWVAAPASTVSSDGLGPLYNARACQSCHIKDGKGHLPIDEKPLSLVVKTGVYEKLKLIPDPIYGKQFQFFAVPGLSSEVSGIILKTDYKKVFLNNYNYKLKKVSLNINQLNYGNLNKKSSLSLRVSPQVYGAGLLEAIEESDLLKKHDPDDSDSDGVTGIARQVLDEKGIKKVGRFGIRASTPNLFVQSGVAFMHDMGISNVVGTNVYGDCTINQKECFKFASGVNSNDKNDENIKRDLNRQKRSCGQHDLLRIGCQSFQNR